MNMLVYFNDIYWREPLWLMVALQPLLVFILKKLNQRNNASLYVEKKLQAWVLFPNEDFKIKHLFSKNSAYILAWIMFAIMFVHVIITVLMGYRWVF